MHDVSTEEFDRLTQEENSLRRLAMLVATAGPSDDILTAICREASDQLDGQEVSLLQFEGTDLVGVVAAHAGPVPQGVWRTYAAGSMSDRIRTTKEPVRVDDYGPESDADLAAEWGIQASVSVPVFIEGEVWGAFSASSQIGPLPADTESRLEGFAQLTWSAVSNTEARKSLRRLADEQAAIRRVAELVARESPLPVVLDAVVKEAARVLEASEAVIRYNEKDEVAPGEVVADARCFSETPGDQTVSTPILVNGQSWGTLEVTSAVASHRNGPDGLKPFVDLVVVAIANARHRDGLTQSRSRVIAAADEARRRLQRDVHDGAQQRLVHTIITLKLARDRSAAEGTGNELLVEALTNAEDANRQLRNIVRGILPASLTRAGLASGIESLAADTPIPVEVDAQIPRLPTAIETSAYFTVAEAITNAIKHSRAIRIRVMAAIDQDRDELVLTVEDDGIGGADPSRGTGLIGLTDRVEASEGVITISSPANNGTRVQARIPLKTGAEDLNADSWTADARMRTRKRM